LADGHVVWRLRAFRFDALVFSEHADNRDYELSDSRISKLWIQRLSDKKTVFNWDRGMVVPAADHVRHEHAAELFDAIQTSPILSVTSPTFSEHRADRCK
jgi:hypothetical protein